MWSADPAQAQTTSGRMGIELNKFEPVTEGDGGCRAYFLFRNDTGKSFQGFEMSLAVLDRGGVIDRLLTIDAAPLPVGRTTLKLFDIPQTGCDAISEMLLHDLPTCQPQNEPAMDCFPLIDLNSRTPAALVK